jgi:pimeloyl-ACP methyl ester carboxylesterase
MTAAADAAVTRHVHRAGGLHWQVRQAGAADAPVLVLLHPSPRSSAMFEPWMKRLAAQFRILAVDTPGYGGSDPLPSPPTQLADYVPPLRALLLDLAGPRFALYGSATGAQIAIAYSLMHPADVQHLFVDNAAHFTPAEHADIVSRYFPDLTPCADGRHLQTAWSLCQAMATYFPWYLQYDAHRFRAGTPSAAEVHASVCELLAAGPGWAGAYRAAFDHENAAHVMALQVPTTVFRWQGSMLLKHINALLAHPLPAHVVGLDTPAAAEARMAAMQLHMLDAMVAVQRATA